MAGHRSRRRGELEEEVVQALWGASEDLSVRDLQTLLSDPVPAYTTLLTVLSRLEEKGRVKRTGGSPRRSRFRSVVSEDVHIGVTMNKTLSRSTDRQAALLQFVGNLDKDDVNMLRAALDTE